MSNILVVDDESDIRDSLKGVLDDEGFHTEQAESGEACLRLVDKQPFDVVLLDVWLPGMDGLETLQKIRELDNPPEVIMISGHGTIETAVRATKLGAYDFLEKPLSIDRILILIKHAIEAKKLRRENRDLKKQLQSKNVIVGDSVPDEGPSPANFHHGAHQRPRPDLWRVGHRQGTGRARDPCPQPAQG